MDKRQKLNITIITSPMPAHNLSTETSLVNFVKMIEQLSKQIFVLTGNFSKDLGSNKIHVISIKYENPQKSVLKLIKYLLMQIRLAQNLIALPNKGGDVTIFYIGNTLLIPLLITKLLRRKSLIVATGSVSKSLDGCSYGKDNHLVHIFRLIEKTNFLLADVIAVESPSIVDFLGLQKFKRKTKVCFARYVDTTCFHIQRKVSKRQNVVAFVGRLSEEKGVLTLIKAIPMILRSKKDVTFLIIGDGPLYGEILCKLKSEGISDKVQVIGWIPHNNLPTYLNKSKLLVLPSYSEGLPGVIVEAMACGSIVLATPVGGIPDIVKDEVTGFLLEKNSAECIAEKVLSILDKNDLEEISIRANEFINNGFSYLSMVEKNKEALHSFLT